MIQAAELQEIIGHRVGVGCLAKVAGGAVLKSALCPSSGPGGFERGLRRRFQRAIDVIVQCGIREIFRV